MRDTVHVKGLSDLARFMDTLPPKLERNVMRGALRAGMRVVQPVARANVHSVSGELARGLKISTRARGGRVTASLRATGKHAHVAKWLEFGTAAHVIASKIGGMLAFGYGVFRKVVQHPGSRPKPFMRPALDQQAGAAVVASAEYMKKRLATKHGLDTANISIEVAE